MSPRKKSTASLARPAGTHDIVNERFYAMQGFFEKAQEVSMYYGFDPIATPIFEEHDLFTQGAGEEARMSSKELFTLQPFGGTKYAMRPEGTIGTLRAYLEAKEYEKNAEVKDPTPNMYYYYGPMFRKGHSDRSEELQQFHQFGIEMIGTTKPIAEGVVIQTFLKILAEAGLSENVYVVINSQGDADSQKSFLSDLRSYYRKHLSDLSAADRQLVKENPLRILMSQHASTKEVNKDIPDPLTHLSSSSKKHFKKVLEYLEEVDVCYTIDKRLTRDAQYYSETIFDIVYKPPVVESAEGEEASAPQPIVIAGGGRYNYLTKRLGHTDEIPAVGMACTAENVVDAPWWNNLSPRIMKKPKFYFIQLGLDARMKSLVLLEKLRVAKIPVIQRLSSGSLTTQLAEAKESEIPYTIIFGQREALDETAIVRNMKTSSQKTVPLEKLVTYLKGLK